MIIETASTALFPLTGMRRGQLGWGETAKRMLKLRRLRFGVDRAAKIHRIAHP